MRARATCVESERSQGDHAREEWEEADRAPWLHSEAISVAHLYTEVKSNLVAQPNYF
jgi:hypothetical protein